MTKITFAKLKWSPRKEHFGSGHASQLEPK